MNGTNELVERNRVYAAGLGRREPAASAPTMRLAIVTCMDARIEIGRMFGLREGEVHVIRNAGGTVTEDVLRSLSISQVVLGTREIVILKHTDCGLARFEEEELRGTIAAATGRLSGVCHGHLSRRRRRCSRSVRSAYGKPADCYKQSVRGFICDVGDGTVREAPF